MVEYYIRLIQVNNARGASSEPIEIKFNRFFDIPVQALY